MSYLIAALVSFAGACFFGNSFTDSLGKALYFYNREMSHLETNMSITNHEFMMNYAFSSVIYLIINFVLLVFSTKCILAYYAHRHRKSHTPQTVKYIPR